MSTGMLSTAHSRGHGLFYTDYINTMIETNSVRMNGMSSMLFLFFSRKRKSVVP